MKILLVFTLYLISGQFLYFSLKTLFLFGCFNVIGYSGGRVTIFCKHYQYTGSDIYFCKERTEQCIHVKTQHRWIHKDRLSFMDSAGVLTVKYKHLSLEDAGLYQCGETGVISELREDDGGVYYCAMGEGGVSVSYNSFFTKTHLQVFVKILYSFMILIGLLNRASHLISFL
uniref:Ig-like domain-containing protein n=1 Tax=Astyanax mexicanus TaxID=7994 RepID=A0A8B9J3Z7_ASTMX